jgi:hypothetical protein
LILIDIFCIIFHKSCIFINFFSNINKTTLKVTSIWQKYHPSWRTDRYMARLKNRRIRRCARRRMIVNTSIFNMCTDRKLTYTETETDHREHSLSQKPWNLGQRSNINTFLNSFGMISNTLSKIIIFYIFEQHNHNIKQTVLYGNP